MATKFSVKGVAIIKRAFDDLEKKVATQIIRKAERKNLQSVKKEVQQTAPVGTGPSEIPHGTIKKYVKIAPNPKRIKGRISMGVRIKFAGNKGEPYWAYAQEAKKHFMKKVFDRTHNQVTDGTISDIYLMTQAEIKRLELDGN